MRRLVYISGNAPPAIATQVHGLWQRQQLFVDALAPLFDEVHCIFWRGLGAGDVREEGQAAAVAGLAFRRPVYATVLQSASRNPNPGFFDFYARSAVLGPPECGHRRVIGEAEVCELQRALRSDATMVFAQGLEAM